MVANYARGGNPNSLAVSYRGAERDVRLQVAAKMAECIIAIEYDLDPLMVLNWSLEPDHYDIVIADFRLDVKSAFPTYEYLIWSLAKNHIFESKQFDALALVKINDQYGVGYSQGWITKGEFSEMKQIAGEGHKLDCGTWYMHQDELRQMWSLR